MSVAYKYRIISSAAETLNYWDKIVDVQFSAAVIGMPNVDNLSLKDGGWFWFLGTSLPYDLVTTDGSVFAETGTNTITISDNEMYELRYFQSTWWKRPLPGSAGGVASVTAGINMKDVGTPLNPILDSHTENVRWTGVIVPGALIGTVNDWNPAGLATASGILATVGVGALLTGIVGGSTGRILFFHNASTNDLIIKSNFGSLGPNQITLPGLSDMTLPAGACCIFQYDASATRWRVTGYQRIFTDPSTIGGTGLPGNPLTAILPPAISINTTYFVDANYGNDGTAVPDSLAFKYQTLEAAFFTGLGSGQPQFNIHIFPGTYTPSVPFTIPINMVVNFYAEKNVVITPNTGDAFIILANDADPAVSAEMNFLGYAKFFCQDAVNPIFRADDPTLGVVKYNFEVDECVFDPLTASAVNRVCNLAGSNGFITMRRMMDMQIYKSGYANVRMAIDYVNQDNFKGIPFYFDSFSNDNGDNIYDAFAKIQTQIYLAARNGSRTEIIGSSATPGAAGGFLIEQGSTPERQRFELHYDCFIKDGFGLIARAGTIDYWGDIYPASDGAGGNVPCLWFDVPTENPVRFVHHDGQCENNENNVILGNQLGIYYFNGRYVSGGEVFPIVKWNSPTGSPTLATWLYYNGIFISKKGTVRLMEINEDTAQGLIYQTFLSNIAVNEIGNIGVFMDNPVFGTPLNIFVAHSLVTNGTIGGVTITDISTGNRWYVDTNIDMRIPSFAA